MSCGYLLSSSCSVVSNHDYNPAWMQLPTVADVKQLSGRWRRGGLSAGPLGVCYRGLVGDNCVSSIDVRCGFRGIR